MLTQEKYGAGMLRDKHETEARIQRGSESDTQVFSFVGMTAA